MTGDLTLTLGDWGLLLVALTSLEADIFRAAETALGDPDLYARHLADLERVKNVRTTLIDWKETR